MADINLPPELLKSLETVTLLMQNVLSDIKEHSTSLAIVKTKLEDLTGNMEALSHVVRDGNGKGSLLTRTALTEKTIEDLEEQANDLKEELHTTAKEIKQLIEQQINSLKQDLTSIKQDDERAKREKSKAKWQAIGTMAAAFVAMALGLFELLHK